MRDVLTVGLATGSSLEALPALPITLAAYCCCRQRQQLGQDPKGQLL
jgi:hypothetical protein